MLDHRIKMLRPLSIRDFALLWTAMAVSLLGDGIYLVAIAWQVYDLSNAPTALSIVGLAWTLPMVLFLLIGGVTSDRFDRRKVMIFADVLRGVAIAAIGVLSVTGVIELWHVIVLVAVYGTGEAFFGPAFGAIVPEIVPQDMLVEANSLDQFVRPLTLRLAGPALGGLAVEFLGGPGGAFLLDSMTFAISALCLLAMTSRAIGRPAEASSALQQIKEGYAFVRSETWLWTTLCSAAIALFFYWGPFEVLVPFVVRNELAGDAGDLGLVFAFGGVGAILVSAVLAQTGFPRRHVLFMYASWTIAVASTAGFAFVGSLWQAMILSFVGAGSAAAGLVVWGTMMHKLVPQELLGRVTSFDWVISIGLVPLSFAATGPIAEAMGTAPTLLASGTLGGLATLGFMLVPGLYDTERDGSMSPAPDVEAREEVHA
ncbi:MAG: MFS transporter [Actinomycetota bacterium]|nr:MFS transporter [Actinomycetota bacterium]